MTCVTSFEEDNRYGILVVVDRFDVTGLPARFVSMCVEAVLQDGDKSVREIGAGLRQDTMHLVVVTKNMRQILFHADYFTAHIGPLYGTFGVRKDRRISG